MKRLLLLAVLVCLLIAPALALSLDFQDSGEFSAYVQCYDALHTGGGSCAYVQSPNGGNSYVSGTRYSIINADPLQTTYFGFTVYTAASLGIIYMDSSYAQMGFTKTITTVSGDRVGIFVIGGTAKIYKNGIWQSTVDQALTQNPSFIAFRGVGGSSATQIDSDDFVYGSSENRYIFGNPEQGYFIKKDMINPAASGFCFPNGTIISSYNMTTTWGFGDSNASQTVILKEWSSGYTAGTKATVAGKQAGSISWPIYDDIINDPTMPYGYYITTISGSGTQSTVVPYIATGATVTFNSATYAKGDTASISWSVDGGGYWDPATYSYRLDTLDVYGNVVDSQAVTAQAGSKSVAFTTSDPLGVYYAVLIATPLAGGNDIWMNFDTCELTGYLVFTGNVYDAETTAVIPVANVSIVQGTTAYNKDTSADGNYTTNVAFYSGTTTLINVTATGYQQYTDSFTPLAAKTIGLNFTLLSSTPTHTGVALAGIVRDAVYGRPISLPTITAANVTHAESYSVTGNSVGYYEIDEDDGVFFTSDRCYTVTGTKTGYGSSSYIKCLGAA